MQRFLLIFWGLALSFQGFSQQGSSEQMALQYWKNGEREKALQLYEEAYSQNPSPHLYQLYFEALMETKDYKGAEKLVKLHAKHYPSGLLSTIDLGFVYLSSGDASKAEKRFQEVMNNLPPNDRQVLDIAINFAQKRLYDQAMQCLLRAREKIGDPQAFALDLANLYEMRNQISEMMQEYLRFMIGNEPTIPYIEQRLQSTLGDDPEGKKAAIMRKEILSVLQKHPENADLQSFWINFLVRIRDFPASLTFAKAYDKRFQDQGQKILSLARTFDQGEDPELSHLAQDLYQYLVDKGEAYPVYYEARIGRMTSLCRQIKREGRVEGSTLASLEQDFQKIIALQVPSVLTFQLLRDWAHILAFYGNDYTRADTLLQWAMKLPQIPGNRLAECKLDLADIYAFTDQVWESLLLYAQVEKDFKHEEIGFDAKLRNAKLSYYMGEFEWSLTQLDVLRAATSKLIANDAMELSLLIRENKDPDSSYSLLRDFARADLYVYQRHYEGALRLLDSLRGRFFMHPLWDDILWKKAEIFSLQQRYDLAIEALESLMSKYPQSLLADDALFRAAQWSEEKLKQPFKALALYEQLILDFPESLWVPLARERFRTLRELK